MKIIKYKIFQFKYNLYLNSDYVYVILEQNINLNVTNIFLYVNK